MSAKENSINKKIQQLDEEVEWFYGDNFSLEKATEKYQKSLALAKEIEKDLNNLENEIEIINKDFSKD